MKIVPIICRGGPCDGHIIKEFEQMPIGQTVKVPMLNLSNDFITCDDPFKVHSYRITEDFFQGNQVADFVR